MDFAGYWLVGVLFVVCTAQLCVLCLVVCAIYLRPMPCRALVLVALVLSAAIGIGSGLYSTFSRPDLQWWPVPLCLTVGFGIYVFACVAQRSSIVSDNLRGR